MYKLFADGSGHPNSRCSGWGYILQGPNGEIQGCGFEDKLMTNRMELLAIVRGLQKLPDKRCQVCIYTDSMFVISHTRFQRDRRDRLWSYFRELLAKHDYTFVKVGNKNQHPNHKRAHHLAREAVFNRLSLDQNLSGDDSACSTKICEEGQCFGYSIFVGTNSTLGTMRVRDLQTNLRSHDPRARKNRRLA